VSKAMTADATTLMQQEWKEAGRRLEADRGDRARYERLLAQVDVVLEELRKNVGHTYTLADLAVAYRDAESWARAAVADRASSSGWPRDLALVVAAAFHAYERGAVDYQR
jgi:alcohol dehydrogenase class IV